MRRVVDQAAEATQPAAEAHEADGCAAAVQLFKDAGRRAARRVARELKDSDASIKDAARQAAAIFETIRSGYQAAKRKLDDEQVALDAKVAILDARELALKRGESVWEDRHRRWVDDVHALGDDSEQEGGLAGPSGVQASDAA